MARDGFGMENRVLFEDSPQACHSASMGPTVKGWNWGLYVWLAYLAFFFVEPIVDHVSAKRWAFYIVGAATFLTLYFSMVRSRHSNRRYALFHLVAIVLLGIIYAPFNPGASTFFIYATAFAPFIVDTSLTAVFLIAGIVGIAGLETWVMHLPLYFPVYACGLAAVIGGSNIFFAQRNRSIADLRLAHDEIAQLAKVAERERIARDLHDVLGHTLSVVILKSELAGKLISREPERAGNEIREVEQIARKALSEVREAIRGYRSRGFSAELAMAKATLETAGITVQCDAPSVPLPPLQEGVLSLAVREAVTNVVRHSQAHHCHLQLEQRNGLYRLEVGDDGRGGSLQEGNGLRGMRERVEMLGGTFTRTTEPGTTLVITLPLTAPAQPEGVQA